MNVTIREVEAPMWKSFVLFQKIDREELKKEKKVTVTAGMHTKTRVSTDMQFKDACNKINIELPGFKFDREENMNYFSGNCSVNHYFKKSKNQGKEAYLLYLEKLIAHVIKEYFHLDMDEITVELIDNAFKN